jgi:hypothetical protein
LGEDELFPFLGVNYQFISAKFWVCKTCHRGRERERVVGRERICWVSGKWTDVLNVSRVKQNISELQQHVQQSTYSLCISCNSNVFYCTCQSLVWPSSKNAIIVEGGREGAWWQGRKEWRGVNCKCEQNAWLLFVCRVTRGQIGEEDSIWSGCRNH